MAVSESPSGNFATSTGGCPRLLDRTQKLTRAAISTGFTVRSAAGGGGTLWVADTDYTFDRVLGTIVWKAGGGIGTTDTVYVSYTGRPRVDWPTINRAKSRMGNPATDAFATVE